MRPSSILRSNVIALCLVGSSAARVDVARAATPSGESRFAVATSLHWTVDQGAHTDLSNLVVSLGNREDVRGIPSTEHRFYMYYRLDVGKIREPETRVEYARSLLLPGALGVTLGVDAGGTDGARQPLMRPAINLGAKVVPWGDGTTAYRAGISGGLRVSARRIFEGSVFLTRAINAIGEADERKVLAASGTPDLWASDLAATAALHTRGGGFGVFGSYGAYLFDSKFHVPVAGRRVVSIGVQKRLG
jgi:hypothetical protein